MEIGDRLKKARTEKGFTQEQIAEELGVSRQSISHWENNRSYPDIVSVIKLSDLYSVSLDELLKEDKNMIRHLAESTDAVASHRRLAKRITLGVYWGFWGLVILLYWLIICLMKSDISLPYGWGLNEILYYIVFPVCTAVISVLIGASRDFGKLRWLYVPITGAMFVLSDIVTWYLDLYLWSILALGLPFNLAELFFYYFENDPSNVKKIFVGLICSAVGLFIGSFIRYFRIARAKQADDKAF